MRRGSPWITKTDQDGRGQVAPAGLVAPGARVGVVPAEVARAARAVLDAPVALDARDGTTVSALVLAGDLDGTTVSGQLAEVMGKAQSDRVVHPGTATDPSEELMAIDQSDRVVPHATATDPNGEPIAIDQSDQVVHHAMGSARVAQVGQVVMGRIAPTATGRLDRLAMVTGNLSAREGATAKGKRVPVARLEMVNVEASQSDLSEKGHLGPREMVRVAPLGTATAGHLETATGAHLEKATADHLAKATGAHPETVRGESVPAVSRPADFALSGSGGLRGVTIESAALKFRIQ